MSLAGYWFWFDESKDDKRDFFHGQVKADLGGGYYLLEFSPTGRMPAGTQEIVNVQRMADEHWSFFDGAEQLRAALNGATG